MSAEFFDEIQQWYVVFYKRRVPRCRFIHWFLNPAFTHVCLIRETPDGKAMLFDPLKWGVAVTFSHGPIDEVLLEISKQSTAVLGYIADYRRCVSFVPRGIYTCVTLAKALLGLKYLTVTPFGLYKQLARHPHTTVVKPYVPYLPDTAGNP